MRLRAIREYTVRFPCDCNACGAMSTTTGYVVTFADDRGVVFADCTFRTEADADFVFDAVNTAYDSAGDQGKHLSEWRK